MAICALTQGHVPKTCKTASGVKEFLLINYENILTITKTAGVVSAITKTTLTKFFAYRQKAESSNWKQDGTGDAKVGTVAYDIIATMDILGIDQATQTELGLLINSTVGIIAHDNDGTYWLLGEDYGMDVATDGMDAGTALGDFRGNKLTFKGRGFTRVSSVDPTIIAALLT